MNPRVKNLTIAGTIILGAAASMILALAGDPKPRIRDAEVDSRASADRESSAVLPVSVERAETRSPGQEAGDMAVSSPGRASGAEAETARVEGDHRGDAPVERSTPGSPRVIVPRTQQERQWFIDTVLTELTEQIPNLCAVDLAKRYRDEISPELPLAMRAQAEQMVARLVAAEFRQRTAADQALRHYVMHAADLSTAARAPGAHGRSGHVGRDVPSGLSPWGARSGTVTVRFFLDYREYAELREAGASLQDLQRQFRALIH